MLTAVLSFSLLGVLFGLGLGWASRRFQVESDPVVDRIDALLLQTQCGQCNYPGCRPYAEAIAAGEARSTSVRRAARRASAPWRSVGVEPLPESRQRRGKPPQVAVIDRRPASATLCIRLVSGRNHRGAERCTRNRRRLHRL
jgi:electron transport complex protein RnfB